MKKGKIRSDAMKNMHVYEIIKNLLKCWKEKQASLYLKHNNISIQLVIYIKNK